MHILQAALRKSKSAAIAEGTRRNLQIQWRKFIGFCLLFAMPWLLASAQALSLYAQFLSTEFKAPSSISNYIGGVKTLHIMLEQSIQGFTAIELRMALRGIARLNPHCPQQASSSHQIFYRQFIAF